MKTALRLLLALTFTTPLLAQVVPSTDIRFKRFDKNNDGTISAEELGMPAVFRQADKNDNGLVTPDEFITYLEQLRGDRRGKTSRRRAPVSASAGEGLRVKRDIPYRDPSGVQSNLQSLDIYTPKDAKNLPVMIYIHGGGWQRGDKAAVGSKPAYFCSRDWVFVSLNYRFVPAVDLLTQLQDSADAIGWVHKHIADHGGDPQQLHLMGHSAGAHHVSILATNERFLKAAGKELSILKSVVELDTQALDVPGMMTGTKNATYVQAFGKDERRWRQVSPLHQIAKGKAIPPFFLVVADNREQKLQQAAAFRKSLQTADVRCEFVEAPEHNHGSLNRAIGEPNDKVTQAMERFHDSVRRLKNSSAAPDDAAPEDKDDFSWQPSLKFDAEKTKQGPLPVNAMQLVVHRGKLFCGMASVNGAMFASDVDSVFRRVDGPRPRWVRVLQFPRGVGDEGRAEVRGLTAVPNPQSLTGWPEEEMLVLATQMKFWRMRVPDDADETHDHTAELDLLPWLGKRLGEPVIFAESAFNRLTPFQTGSDAAPLWPIGFQVVYPVPGKKLSRRDPDSYRLKDDAWFLLRDVQANYKLHRIDSDARLFLARDFKASPFASEPHILYACGYNGSHFKGSLGTAWIYRGKSVTNTEMSMVGDR